MFCLYERNTPIHKAMLSDCEQVRGQKKLPSVGIKGIKQKVTWIWVNRRDGRQKKHGWENTVLGIAAAGWVSSELVLGGTFHYCYTQNNHLSGLYKSRMNVYIVHQGSTV